MPLTQISYSEELFIATLCLAVMTLLFTFGGQIIKELQRGGKGLSSSITQKEVSWYFMEQGYIVCNISPVQNTNKWLAFLIRNGEYEVATVFTNGDMIEGHQHAIV
jgi:hypothetical protein